MADAYSLHEFTLPAGEEPLFARLADAIPGLGRRPAREAILAGLVQCSGQVVREPNYVLERKAKIRLDLSNGIKKVRQAQRFGSSGGNEAKPFTILHEDSQVIVVDKAAGVLSAPSVRGERGHIAEHLRTIWKAEGRPVSYIGQIHRLDQDTSGCLIFALTREAQRLLSTQFAGDAASRIYRCVVAGMPALPGGTIRSTLGRGDDGRRASIANEDAGKEAITHWKMVRRLAGASELEVTLETGRTHQIRIHLSEMRNPVLGDRVYGRRFLEKAPKAPRLMLHAWKLAFDHPRTGERVTVTAPLPPVFDEVTKPLLKPLLKPR
jgi:23S rRNA pseudouridine1911/1915/1917 synthase